MTSIENRIELTELVLDKLRRGVCPSRLLWDPNRSMQSTHRPLRYSGEPYRGGNRLRLSLQAIHCGFESPYWLTVREAEVFGAELGPNRKGVTIFECGFANNSVTPDYFHRIDKEVFFQKSSVVFNADQFLRLKIEDQQAAGQSATRWLPPDTGWIFARIGAHFEFGSPELRYDPFTDSIGIPFSSAFFEDERHASALVHEHIHWTGHETRLKRGLERTSCGSPAYAFEELIAGIGTAFFCSDLQITPLFRRDHYPYWQRWLEQLKSDERAIYVAADQALEAVDYLNALCAPLEECEGLRSTNPSIANSTKMLNVSTTRFA